MTKSELRFLHPVVVYTNIQELSVKPTLYFHFDHQHNSLPWCRILTLLKYSHYMNSTIFWDITTCSPLKVNIRFGRSCRLHLQIRRISQVRNQKTEFCLLPAFTLVSCSAFSSTLKMEMIYSSETSVDF
jgi:hypothetical protein